MSRIRGGLNWCDIRISGRKLFGLHEKANLLVAISDSAKDYLQDHLFEKGHIIYNGTAGANDANFEIFAFDFAETAKQAGGSKVMANSVAAGAVFAAFGYDMSILADYLHEEFGAKGEDIVDKNIASAKAGYDKIASLNYHIPAPEPSKKQWGTLTSGAYTVALAAATAGVKFVTAYPMSPSTATFTHLARLADKYGILVEQAEDELAAINMVCGATYVGVPAMTTTSGGGFSLMCEGVSLAGMMELPAVVVLAQRPAPATGLPTRTGQEDLRLAIFSGHGEFAKAVFAPGNLRQCYDLMRHAIDTAHKFQTPVILLTDQYQQDLMQNIETLDDKYDPVPRHIEDNPSGEYLRYKITDGGVSPRALPGGEDFVVCDSDEHAEDGHITEDLGVRVKMQNKRMAKLDILRAETIEPQLFAEEGADTLLVCWGSTLGPAREAAEVLSQKGIPTAMLHFSQVWPLDIDNVNQQLEPYRRVIVVEGNYTGQFATLLRSEGCLKTLDSLVRYDGMPFTAEFIAREVEK
jgi:2-oxoglutarate ferredoxin oxidoreductase subunit alpha